MHKKNFLSCASVSPANTRVISYLPLICTRRKVKTFGVVFAVKKKSYCKILKKSNMKKLILGICVFAFTGALQAQEVVKIVASTNSGKNMLQVFTAEGEEKEVIKNEGDLNKALFEKLIEFKKAGFIEKNYQVIVYPYQTTGLGGSVTSASYLTSREEIFYYWKE